MTRNTITDDSLAPLIEIFIWVCLVISILASIVRVAIKIQVIRKIGLDGYLIAVSLVWPSPCGLS